MAAPKKKMHGGGRTFGVWPRLFRAQGAHPCTRVSEGGVDKLLVRGLVVSCVCIYDCPLAVSAIGVPAVSPMNSLALCAGCSRIDVL